MPWVRQPHVSLRTPTAADGPEFLALMRASIDLHQPWVKSPRTSRAFDRFVERSRKPEYETLLVIERATGAIAGFFNLSQIFRGPMQSAYLSYCIGAPYAGRGYATAGLQAVLRRAFGFMHLHRLEANIQPGNTPSLRLVERGGFQREGFSPRYLKINGEWRDHERWAILVEDWKQRAVGGPSEPRGRLCRKCG